MSLFPCRSARILRIPGQTEVHSESNNSLNVCPLVEDEMDEEDMDDQEEQSEKSRAVRVGQKKKMTPTLARTGGT